jgi:hypothetical protein
MDAVGLIRMSDVVAAERLLDEAVARRDALRQPENWAGARESVDREGRRTLELEAAHFEIREAADLQVQRARQRVIATRRAWCGLDITTMEGM